MLPPMITGWPLAVLGRKLRMARGEGAGRALAVDEQLALEPADPCSSTFAVLWATS